METAAISSVGAGFTPQRTTSRGFGDLRSEDFFGLLIAELRNQDPLKPTDNQQLLSQLSTIRQMEQSSSLNSTLQTLAGEQRFGSTAGLMGHYVYGTARNSAGSMVEIEGIVIGVHYNSKGEATLELHNGLSLPSTRVELVTLVENLPPEIRERLGLSPVATDDDEDDAVDETPEESPDEDGEVAAPPADTQRQKMADGWAMRTTQALDSTGMVLDRLFSPSIGVGI